MTTQTIADGLIYGDKWNKTTITYSFKDNVELPYEQIDDSTGSVPVSDALKSAAEDIFLYLGTILNLEFVYEADAIGDIVISQKQMSDPYTLGYSYLPYSDSIGSSGDIYISAAFNDVDFEKGGMGYSTLIHELGHSLGLDHPFGDGFYSGVTINDTIMSYNSYQGYDPFNVGYYYDVSSYTSFQSADILALQTLYGVPTYVEDNIYDLRDMLYASTINGYTGLINDNIVTIYDNGGIDTVSLQNVFTYEKQYIDINSGAQSVIIDGTIHHYLTLTPDTAIENVIGSKADDTIVLNSLNNHIDGLNGYDTVIENGIDSQTRIDVFNNYIVIAGIDSGFDVLQDVESLYVDNVNINLSSYERSLISYTDEKEAQIGRLYLSVLDRVADKEGLDYWMQNLNHGQTIQDIANSFLLSSEFAVYNDNQTNEEFIDTLYQHVLFRTADSAGMEYWLDEIQTGMTRADIVVSFSDSQEFIDLTGIYFQDNTMVVS